MAPQYLWTQPGHINTVFNPTTPSGGDTLMNSRLKDEYMDQLFKAVLSLESIGECYKFFEDLCTINELKSMVQRLEVARMLQEGCTYNQIEKETGASTATISRVKRYLYYGSGGYTIALERIEGKEKS